MATLSPSRQLQLFNEKAAELASYSFVKLLMENPNLVTVRYDGHNIELETKFPNRESMSAFVHILRQFIQKSEPVSFREIAKVYQDLPARGDVKNEFSTIQASLNQFLDSQSDEFSIADEAPDGGPPVEFDLQHRRILDTFINGGFSHSDAPKRAQLDEWQAHAMTFAIVSHIFTSCLAVVFTHIMAVKRLNERVLTELGS